MGQGHSEKKKKKELALPDETTLASIASERARILRKLLQRTTKFHQRMVYFHDRVASGIVIARLCDVRWSDFGYLQYVPGILFSFLHRLELIVSDGDLGDGAMVASEISLYRSELHYFTLLSRDFSDAIAQFRGLIESSWPLREKLEEIYDVAPENCANYHILDLFTLPFEELRMYEVFAKRFLAIEYDEKVRRSYERIAREIEFSLKSVNRDWDWDFAAELREERRRRKYAVASEDELERLEFLWTWGCEHYEHLGRNAILVVGIDGEDKSFVKLLLWRLLLFLV